MDDLVAHAISIVNQSNITEYGQAEIINLLESYLELLNQEN